MIIVGFVIASVIYFYFLKKVEYWQTIKYLGFASECPELFLKKQYLYEIVKFLLLSTIVIFWVFIDNLSNFFFVPYVAVIWYIGVKSGRKIACQKYREILTEFIEFEDGEDDKEKYIKQLSKTNDELIDFPL